MERNKSEPKRSLDKHRLHLWQGIFFVAVLLLSVSLLAFFLPDDASSEQAAWSEEPEETVSAEAASAGSQSTDFPSTEEGTFSAWVREQYYKEQLDPMVVFFVSEKISGLSLVYYPEEQKLVAGTPPLIADGVRFFDGQAHHLAYSFQKDGEQRLYYDGKLVGVSSFVPKEKNSLTGLVTGTASNFVSEALYEVEIR